MHLRIFLLETRFNQLSPQKVSFEVFFRNIIGSFRNYWTRAPEN